MKFPIKKSRSFFRKIGSCASYASYASCASYAYCASKNRRIFGIKAMGMNSFHRLRTPSTVCGRSPSLDEGGLGLRRSRPAALPSIVYRGFAVAPMTLRAPTRRVLYNSGCRTYEKKFRRNIPLHLYGESISHSSALMRRMPS